MPLAVEPGGSRRHVRRELPDTDVENRVTGAQIALHFAESLDRRVERRGADEFVARADGVSHGLLLPGPLERLEREVVQLAAKLPRGVAPAPGYLASSSSRSSFARTLSE